MGDGSDYYCLDEGRCYTVKVTDSWGDGLYDGEGNYVGYLDDEIEFVGDGDFAYEETHEFCVGTSQQTSEPTPNPTPEPTVSPTKAPTVSPTKTPPTNASSESPTKSPSGSPTKSPTISPTKSPTKSP